jgi:hypothetical protein
MKITKKILKETFNIKTKDKKTFSEVSQNVIISEEQLERLINKINFNESKKSN